MERARSEKENQDPEGIDWHFAVLEKQEGVLFGPKRPKLHTIVLLSSRSNTYLTYIHTYIHIDHTRATLLVATVASIRS
jgi:hypothetical protein